MSENIGNDGQVDSGPPRPRVISGPEDYKMGFQVGWEAGLRADLSDLADEPRLRHAIGFIWDAGWAAHEAYESATAHRARVPFTRRLREAKAMMSEHPTSERWTDREQALFQNGVMEGIRRGVDIARANDDESGGFSCSCGHGSPDDCAYESAR